MMITNFILLYTWISKVVNFSYDLICVNETNTVLLTVYKYVLLKQAWQFIRNRILKLN